MRLAFPVVALLLAGCASSTSHMSPSSVSYRYDPALTNAVALIPKAEEHCSRFGKKARMVGEFRAHHLGFFRGVTFDCAALSDGSPAADAGFSDFTAGGAVTP